MIAVTIQFPTTKVRPVDITSIPGIRKTAEIKTDRFYIVYFVLVVMPSALTLGPLSDAVDVIENLTQKLALRVDRKIFSIIAV